MLPLFWIIFLCCIDKDREMFKLEKKLIMFQLSLQCGRYMYMIVYFVIYCNSPALSKNFSKWTKCMSNTIFFSFPCCTMVHFKSYTDRANDWLKMFHFSFWQGLYFWFCIFFLLHLLQHRKTLWGFRKYIHENAHLIVVLMTDVRNI